MVDSEGRKVIVCDNGTGVSVFESTAMSDNNHALFFNFP